jgi:predicted small secreted protein
MRRDVLQRRIALLLLVLSSWTTGCATLRGLGEDIQSLGRGITQVFTQ